MSLLDDDDSFCPCELEHANGIAALPTLNEDSIHTYSRSKLQRHTQARQRLDPKDQEKYAASAKHRVEPTISEDLADGQDAILDASLELLGDDELVLLLPNDEPDEEEIHIIEAPVATVSGNNHQLQDYQMQLMLLEQQNKKRLLQARQEQDSLNQPSRERPLPRPREALRGRVNGSKSQQAQAIQAAYDMAQKRSEAGTGPTTRKKMRARNNGPKDDLKGKAVPVDPQRGPAEILSPYFEKIYQVTCSHEYYRTGGHDKSNHPVPAFRDVPTTGKHSNYDMGWNTQSHLNGKIPIFDLEDYMNNATDGIAFVVIRTIDCSETSVQMSLAGVSLPYTEKVYIKSAIARHALEAITTCYFNPVEEQRRGPTYFGRVEEQRQEPAYERNRITPVDLFLFHHRMLLADYVVQHPVSKPHMEPLLQYMESHFESEFAEAEDLFTRQLVTKEHILKLFKPNEIVVSGTHGRPAAFVIHKWPELTSDGWVTIECWSFQTEGSQFARKRSTLSILPIGTQPQQIQTLAAYPLRYATSDVRSSIAAHGEVQWKLRYATQITYKGWNIKNDQYFPDARFMIDHSIYRKMHPAALAFDFEKPMTTYPFDHMPASLILEQNPPADSLLLLPPDVHGFYLNEKKWVHLYVDSVHPVAWNKKAYERLVLPSQTKDLVQALVNVRTSQRGVKQGIGLSGKRTDITAGKGNGLIMLLHGGPGTGKTLTAESVAEIAEMPLYRVTCGDIGTSAEAVEKYLNTVLHLGKIWNCVLLLDEADVFLEERSMSDLKRNSLVSVFLRILEYYDGILILTSNRVGMFDEAFKSRIQVALHYENLNRSSRRQIWQNFIDMLEEDEEDVNFDEIKLHIDDLAGKELNGRQIRNVLTTARQLAIYRNERLEWEHLIQALSVSSDFSAYLKRMQGHTDDQRARDVGLR